MIWYDAPARASAVQQLDALGLQHLEDRIADWFWPGFSRRTTRAGYYVVTLYGLRMAELAADRYALPRDDDTRRFLFSRFERLWAMSQFAATQGAVEAEDVMFGMEGTAVAFAERDDDFPLDYVFLQEGEVGALGSYLASLRTHRLVAPRQLRLSPVGWELAQSMWPPEASAPSLDELVLTALNPRVSAVSSRQRNRLNAIGQHGRLSVLAARADVKEWIWRRLFEERPPPAALGVLRQMAAHLRAAARSDSAEPDRILADLVTHRSSGSSSQELRQAARIALTVSALGKILLQIFDGIQRTIQANGYSADWNRCVQAAVTPQLIAAVNEEMAAYRKLDCNEAIEGLSSCGQVFAQTMRRFNTQNPYSTFESVLSLHAMSHRALSRGEGWIARSGETVFFRHASTDRTGSEAERWAPTFRMKAMSQLLAELGQLQ